jgi:hypothetical protein
LQIAKCKLQIEAIDSVELKLVGAGRLALPRLPDSESGGSTIPHEPHAGFLNANCRSQIADSHMSASGGDNLQFEICNLQLKVAHPAGLSPANSPFEAEHDCNFTTDAEMVAADGNAPSTPRL